MPLPAGEYSGRPSVLVQVQVPEPRSICVLAGTQSSVYPYQVQVPGDDKRPGA